MTWPTDLNPDYDESTNPNVSAMPAGVPANVDKPYRLTHTQFRLTFLLLLVDRVKFTSDLIGQVLGDMLGLLTISKSLEQPANDVVLNSEVFVGVNNEGIEYGRTPITQLDDSYEVAAYGENFGSELLQTNVAVDVDFGSIILQLRHGWRRFIC